MTLLWLPLSSYWTDFLILKHQIIYFMCSEVFKTYNMKTEAWNAKVGIFLSDFFPQFPQLLGESIKFVLQKNNTIKTFKFFK